ncbi:hypothetical protein [Fulvivirga sedimenti]|uniref:Uncharacterized protein n=1 Tax=Fulvivirga sedimenti TaxID=2879465 RepID=A0A9X1HK03_9BACT|nr:hypothetical protein [Fulvivirga sedimenti]MCA6073500.1 hypothetical protein [Fulvivirga sedimenti]
MRVFFLLGLIGGLITGCATQVKEKKELEGYWILEEVYSSGLQQQISDGAHIVFKGDGTYSALLNAESGPMTGKWNIQSNVMKLWQPEITDMHGDRSIEPYMSTWQMSLSENWLILDGLPTYDMQHLKLVLHRKVD